MRIDYTSIHVDNQDKALAFYTEKLGFLKKMDVPAGGARWITVVSPEAPEEVELVLEPGDHPAASAYTTALREEGIPITAFTVDDVQAEFERLIALSVSFTLEPKTEPWGKYAIFDDTVGNLLQIQEIQG